MAGRMRFPAWVAAIPAVLSLLSALAVGACRHNVTTAWSPASNAPGAPAPTKAPGPTFKITTRPAPGRPPPDRRLCFSHCGYRLDGGVPYSVVTAATDADCCDACSENATCGAWVRDNRTAMCALKNETFSLGMLMENANFTAGGSTDEVVGPDTLEMCSPGHGTCVQCAPKFARIIIGEVDDEGGQAFPCSSSEGQVFMGATINGGGQSTGDAQACCDLCQRRDGTCFLWSWRRGDGRCLLRSRWGGVASNSNFVSGSLF